MISNQRQLLQVQLLDVRRLLTSLGDEPFMSIALKYRETELKREIEKLDNAPTEAKVELLFSGKPVMGSMGIDITFAGKVVPSFQKMVSTFFTQKNASQLRKKTKEQKQRISKLYLTALPRGSFGLELRKLEHEDLFEEALLAETLVEITNLVGASASSDEEFEQVLPETPVQTLKNLKEFLNTVSSEKAGLSIESGNNKVELTSGEARQAFERVNATVTEETNITMEGVFRGILLDSWRFDFQPVDGKRVSGRIGDEVSEDNAQMYNRNYTNKNVLVELEQSIIIFKDKKPRKVFKLLSIKDDQE